MRNFRDWCKQRYFLMLCVIEASTFVGLTCAMMAIRLSILGFVTAALSLLVKLSMVHQIRVLLRHSSANEHSWHNHAINALSYLLWGVYGWRDGGVVVLVGQGSGFVLATVVLTLVIKYQLKHPRTEFGHHISPHCKECQQTADNYAEVGLTERPSIGKWPIVCFACRRNIHAQHLSEPGSEWEGKGVFIHTVCDGCAITRDFWIAFEPDPNGSVNPRYWKGTKSFPGIKTWREVDFAEFKAAELEGIKIREYFYELSGYRLNGYMLGWGFNGRVAFCVTAGFEPEPDIEVTDEALMAYCVPNWAKSEPHVGQYW